MHYNTVFQQLFNLIPRRRFEKSVEILGGERRCKHFSAWEQFLTLLYAQITGQDSLREIETPPLSNRNTLEHRLPRPKLDVKRDCTDFPSLSIC